MLPDLEHALALAQLGWQIDLGATEAICEHPVNRYDQPVTAKKPAAKPPSAPEQGQRSAAQTDANQTLTTADALAAGATTLAELRDALAAFDGCELEKGARNLVFSDGNPMARLMIVGEAPGREEDIKGRPFVGRAGQLLDRMLAAIELSRDSQAPDSAVYIANVLPWRPPHNRDPSPEEIAMLLPFLRRHIALAAPDILVLMGNTACAALLGQKGITRLRGTWTSVDGIATLPMFHPAYLLRNPEKKRESWADLLAVSAHLKGNGNAQD